MSSPSSPPEVQIRSRIPRLAEEAVERARLRVVPRRRTSAPRVPFVTLVSLLLLTGVVGLLLFNTSMQQASFAATALEQQAENLTARQQTLQVELERLRDPQRVAEQARKQGLVPPPIPAFLDLETGEVTGTPTPASPDSDLNIAPPPPILPGALDPDPVVVRVPRGPVQTEGRGGDEQTKQNKKSKKDRRDSGGQQPGGDRR